MARMSKAQKSKVQASICERMIEGDSLRTICRDEKMPSASTVFRWLADDSDAGAAFREQYARAREGQADALFESILEIADDGTNDYVERLRADGERDVVFDSEHVQRSRLRVDARKWMAGKLSPKKYGDDLRLRHADADGEKLPMDGPAVAARLASIIASIEKRKASGGRENDDGN